MPWIQNISKSDVMHGRHANEEGMILIQIVDPAMEFPKSKQVFSVVHQFEFLDVGQDHELAEWGITDGQAKEIANILEEALTSGRSVVVHCTAGICRSGAVAEVGVLMGFEDKKTHRIPNVMVKSKLFYALGWSYDSPVKAKRTPI